MDKEKNESEIPAEFNELKKEFDTFFEEKPLTEIQKLEQKLDQARQDYATLYSEVHSDLKRLKSQVAGIKPVLKVSDPESEKFIRNVLSKHDSTVRTQQTAIEEKMLQLRDIESSIEGKMKFFYLEVKEVNGKFDLIINKLKEIQIANKPTFGQKLKALFTR